MVVSWNSHCLLMTLRIHRDSRYIYKKLSRNLLAITVYYLGKMGNPSAFIWNLRFIGESRSSHGILTNSWDFWSRWYPWNWLWSFKNAWVTRGGHMGFLGFLVIFPHSSPATLEDLGIYSSDPCEIWHMPCIALHVAGGFWRAKGVFFLRRAWSLTTRLKKDGNPLNKADSLECLWQGLVKKKGTCSPLL